MQGSVGGPIISKAQFNSPAQGTFRILRNQIIIFTIISHIDIFILRFHMVDKNEFDWLVHLVHHTTDLLLMCVACMSQVKQRNRQQVKCSTTLAQ